MNKWVSIADKTPAHGQEVIIYQRSMSPTMTVVVWDGSYKTPQENISHWAVLPKPPV